MHKGRRKPRARPGQSHRFRTLVESLHPLPRELQVDIPLSRQSPYVRNFGVLVSSFESSIEYRDMLEGVHSLDMFKAHYTPSNKQY